jgi:hypothetical protein
MCRLDGTKAASIFAIALTISNPNDFDRALNALNETMGSAQRARALLDGFDLLCSVERIHAARVQGGPLFAAAFTVDNRDEMIRMLEECMEDPVDRARARIAGFKALSETCKIRVTGSRGASLFASAFVIKDSAEREGALVMLEAYMSPADCGPVMLRGFRLLPEADKTCRLNVLFDRLAAAADRLCSDGGLAKRA